MQCGDAGPLLNIMGVYHKLDVETDKQDGQVDHKEDGQVYHKQDDRAYHKQDDYTDQEEGQVEEAAPLMDGVQSCAGAPPGGPARKALMNNLQNRRNNLQNLISQDLLPKFDQTASLPTNEKLKTSGSGFAENSHSDILDKQIDNAINAVMRETNLKKPTAFTDEEEDDATGLLEDVKLEQEESNLVEFFEEPQNTLEHTENNLDQPENNLDQDLDKKFVKANRRVYTLEKSLLRANRRVYNLPLEVNVYLMFSGGECFLLQFSISR